MTKFSEPMVLQTAGSDLRSDLSKADNGLIIISDYFPLSQTRQLENKLNGARDPRYFPSSA